jgi:CRP-like cAMP-binding protein
VAIQARVPFDSIPLLSTLKPDDRAVLEPLCRMRGYEKGEVIFREADPADRIHFVYASRVKIVKAAGTRDIIIEILGPGEPAGAVAAFERRPFPATAIALEPAGVLSIPEREFFELLERRPEMTRSLLAGLTMRLMMVNKRLADMTGSAEARAARVFLTLAERVGTKDGSRAFIPLSSCAAIVCSSSRTARARDRSLPSRHTPNRERPAAPDSGPPSRWPSRSRRSPRESNSRSRLFAARSPTNPHNVRQRMRRSA